MTPTSTLAAVDQIAGHLEQLAGDTTAPKPVRDAAREWARITSTVAEHHRQLDHAGRAARAALADAKHHAPAGYLEQLAAGVAVDPETLGDYLDEHREAVDRAETRYAISTRALGTVGTAARAAVIVPHVEPLVRWIGDHRTSTPWWEPVPAHVAWVHAITSRAYRVVLPADAATIGTTDGGTRTVGNVAHLHLEADTVPTTAELPYARHHWAWSVIAAGGYTWSPATTPNGRARLRITADYETRAPLPPRPTAPTGGRARRLVSRLAA